MNHLLLLVLFSVALPELSTAQYVVDATEGCVDVSVTLPGPFKVLRIDDTDYEFDGEGYCNKAWDPSDSVVCRLTENDDGTYQGFARICDVESHIWAGFRVEDYMQNKRYAFVTVYFSQGGEFANIDKNCIQPQRSSPAIIDAKGKFDVTIECARKHECPMGLYTTIMTATRDVCRDYSDPKCKEKVDGDVRVLRTTFRKPSNEKQSFVFCSTGDSFLSYLVKWE